MLGDMHALITFLIGGLVVGVEGGTECPQATVEHYCFPRVGGPLSAGSTWPPMTIILNNATLTTTPIAASKCEVMALLPTPKSGNSMSACGCSRSAANMVQSESTVSVKQPSRTTSIVSATVSPRTESGHALLTTSAPVTSRLVPTTSSRSTSPAATLESSFTLTPSPNSRGADPQNATLKLSPAATSALQMAQFLKNLGVWLFRPSNTTSDNPTTILIAHTVANISLQEIAQQRTLQELFHRAGTTAVPPCQYSLPRNSSDRLALMASLKTIEVGVLFALADSLSPGDHTAAIVLSSIATASARQNALLRTYVDGSTNMASFETPLSKTWAYNLVLHHVLPGTCPVELPIPILPTLSLNNTVAAYVQPGTNVTFAWDAAGRAAASRSGKPLYIGWVNQIGPPTYSLVKALGGGLGETEVPLELSGTAFAVLTTQSGLSTIEELTEATLAGPVLISVLM